MKELLLKLAHLFYEKQNNISVQLYSAAAPQKQSFLKTYIQKHRRACSLFIVAHENYISEYLNVRATQKLKCVHFFFFVSDTNKNNIFF